MHHLSICRLAAYVARKVLKEYWKNHCDNVNNCDAFMISMHLHTYLVVSFHFPGRPWIWTAAHRHFGVCTLERVAVALFTEIWKTIFGFFYSLWIFLLAQLIFLKFIFRFSLLRYKVVVVVVFIWRQYACLQIIYFSAWIW